MSRHPRPAHTTRHHTARLHAARLHARHRIVASLAVALAVSQSGATIATAQDTAPTLPPIGSDGGVTVVVVTPGSPVLPPEQVIAPPPPADATADGSSLSAGGRLVEVRQRGANEIAKRQKTLADLSGKLAGQKADCGANATMAAEIGRTSASLSTVGQQLAVTGDLTTARRLYQSIFIDHRVYILVQPKARHVMRCNGQLVRNQALATEAARLQTTIDQLRGRGVDVSAAQTAKDAAVASLATTNPAGALQAILGLGPDRGVQAVRDANTAALRQADATLDANAARQKDIDRQLDRVRSSLRDADRAADRTERERKKELQRLEREQRKEDDRVRRDDRNDRKDGNDDNDKKDKKDQKDKRDD